MAKFNFRLQRVLDIREVEFEKTQNELYQEKSKQKAIEERLKAHEEKLMDAYNYIRDNQLTVTENIQARQHIKKIKEAIETIEEQYHLQQQVVKDYKSELIRRRQNKEKLIKLKDKEFSAFKKDFLKSEQKEIDELSLRMMTQGG